MSIMSTKIGTKAWAEPKADDPAFEKAQTRLTESQKQQLGEENIGAVLNKISDPNWVDPSKKARGVGNNAMDKDAFFKLMMAQLKHQDPTNPLKNHEMAAQLAQFSSLEQMSNINTTLKEMKAGNKPIEQFQALNLIGKQVAGDSAKIVRSEVDKEHEFAFKLPQDVKTADVKVLNSKGVVVREYKFNELKTGANSVRWNGETADGKKAPAGDYVFQIEAVGSNGQKVNVKTDFEGIVSGMSFSNEGPVLQVGKQTLRLKDIRQFSDPSLMSNDQKSNDVTELDLKKDSTATKNNIKEETKTAAQKQAMAGSTEDMMASVGMSNELMDKLNREMSEQGSQNVAANGENQSGPEKGAY